jgi:integrase
MILLALRTGLRLGELMALRWQDVDLVAGKLVVRQNVVRGFIGTPKSGRAREVPLGDEVLAAMKRQRHLRGPLVFCKALGGMHVQPKVRWELEKACKRAQLRVVGWHVLRHTFASHLAMRGAPLKAIQELLGHATIQMTMRYAHLSPDVARDAVKLLDSPRRGSSVAAEPKLAAK